jgi:predicted nucleic acid-binding protein
MKICFDTSALVAALLQKHPHHTLAFPQLQAVLSGQTQDYLTTHAVAELFATLTALPLRPKLLPADVQRLITESILPHFTLIPLGHEDYAAAMALTVAQNCSSGAIYDTLHLVGARAAACQKLFTFNLRHFKALAPADPMVCSP